MKIKNQQKGQSSLLLKAVIILVFTLLMLIPISQLESLIIERSNNQQKVFTELGLKWGERQTLKGPILVVPFNKYPDLSTSYAYFLPEELDVTGKIITEPRSRGMFNVLCYQSELNLTGKFDFPNIAKLGLNPNQLQWDKAFFAIGLSNLSSIKNKVNANINNKQFDVTAASNIKGLNTPGLLIDYPIDATTDSNRTYTFNFDLNLNGMDALYLSPAGKETTIQLSSPWKTVSFAGDYLPNERVVNENGFDAKWEILDYNRNFPQMWIGDNTEFNQTTVGVEIAQPVDNYLKIMRSVKYAILFISLTFMVFFLIEILSKNRIHPIQYLLVSFALIMFYSLLLAFSEHVGFDLAYFISAISVIIMITAYSKSVLKTIKEVLLIFIFLIVLYTFLYVVVQLEEMSLLLGSIGLFIMLAIVMYASRNVDWYAIKEQKSLKKENKDETKKPTENKDEDDFVNFDCNNENIDKSKENNNQDSYTRWKDDL